MISKREELSKLEAEQSKLQRELLMARRSNEGIDQSKIREVRRVQQEVTTLKLELANYDDSGNAIALAMAVQDKPVNPAGNRLSGMLRRNGDRAAFVSITNSPLFARGELELAGEAVQRQVPEIFGKSTRYEIPADASGRLQLARWIVDERNPMTARVAANRIWTWVFDEPIVDSVDNFGTSGSLPKHPELLDYLAWRLMEQNWSQKSLIKEILLSKTYRTASLKNPNSRQKTLTIIRCGERT